MTTKAINTAEHVESPKYAGHIVGASCVFYYRPSYSWFFSPRIILIKHVTGTYGIPGGLASPGDEGNFARTAIREASEELRDRNNNPALSKIDANRLTLVASGKEDPQKPEWNPVHWHGFKCEIDYKEYVKLEALTRISTAAHLAHTEREIEAVEIMDAAGLLRKIESGKINFTYPSSNYTLGIVLRELLNRPQPPKSKVVKGATLDP